MDLSTIRRPSATRILWHAVGALLLSTACGDSATKPPPVVTVTVSPNAVAIRLGQSASLAATARDAQGATLTRPISWSSSNASIATVTADGVVVGVAIGTATITASAEGVNGTASVAVSAIPVATVSLSPSMFVRVPQQMMQLAATLTDSVGQAATARSIEWTTNAPNVASVSSTGVVTAVGLGSAIITATSEGKSGLAQITVVAPSVTLSSTSVLIPYLGTAPLTATVRDADGVVLTDRAVTWSSSDTVAVRVSTTGVVSGVARGRPIATVTASANGGLATAAVNVALTFSSLSAGMMQTTCGISAGGVAYCWGNNAAGMLGDSSQISRSSPVVVSVPPGELFESITVGAFHACARTTNGVSYCWGQNQATGTGVIGASLIPTPVVTPSGVTFAALTAGSGTTCGLTGGGVAYCWGANFDGQLGIGTTIEMPLPAPVSGGLTFTSIATNADHTCGISTNGTTYCWGNNRQGGIGDGTLVGRTIPVPVAAGPLRFTRVSRGSWVNTCALVSGGQAYCWGLNDYGQIGEGVSSGPRTIPTPLSGGLVFATVDGGASFACGRTTTNRAYCWGYNNDGRLGDGTTMFKLAPVPVAGGRTFQQVVVGGSHACGLTPEGFAYCWGSNSAGQIGDGEPSVGSRLIPVLVR